MVGVHSLLTLSFSTVEVCVSHYSLYISHTVDIVIMSKSLIPSIKMLLGTPLLLIILSNAITTMAMAPTKEPFSLWEGETRVEQFSQGDFHKSREAKFGVWIRNGRVYKLFSKADQAEKVLTLTNEALTANVPTPAMNVIAGTWIDKDKKSNRVWAGVTEQLNGRKFQLSKGHLEMIKTEIRNAKDTEVWTKTLQGVTAAVNFKLTDPQGFFLAEHNPPISFIDIHKGSTAPGYLIDLQKFVQSLLKPTLQTNVDKKLNNGLLFKSTRSRIMCSVACIKLPDCVSYNYKDDGLQCELLSTGVTNIEQLTAASGWSNMGHVPPKRPKPEDSCDSPDSVAIQYDQPSNLRFDDTIPGYACTQHSWVLDQRTIGLTDCHFVLEYETEFSGLDSTYNNQYVTYHEAFTHCESVNCVGMVCFKGSADSDGVPFRCWLKYGTHLTDTTKMRTPHSDLMFWYVSCKSP
ncbi:hypothetical protein Pmani_035184 [Petrolisthes manimaculis]|uniref:Apple domain-containing protein n=1 Tax=Petrolisthes manimaculis TaxID=1843537 RepID=A0AAE1NND5_9EUCA|nr:hypothetical protein Pmani_035184 [Petrolisthes manimaculis]